MFNILKETKMKNQHLIVVLLGLIFLFTGEFLYAQGGKRGNPNAPRYYRNCQFVDANNDGICDNFIDANGDGKCDNCRGQGLCDGTGVRNARGKNRGMGQGRNFVDANGDGICDNYQNRIVIGMPYPNPFSSSTKFDLTLQKEQKITIGLYDQNGNLMQKIFDGNLNPGTHSFTINADKMQAGRYFIIAKSGKITRSRPLVFRP